MAFKALNFCGKERFGSVKIGADRPYRDPILSNHIK